MRATKLLITSVLSAGLLLSACSPAGNKAPTKAEMVETHSQALNDWFQARYEDELARSPMTQTYLGMKDKQGQLDDASQLADDETAALAKSWLEDMRRNFDIDRLDKQTALSYRLLNLRLKTNWRVINLRAMNMSSNIWAAHIQIFPHS